MLSPILTLFARISKPLWLNIRSTGAEVAGGQKIFSSKSQDQDRDRDSRVPRPRPRPRLRGSRPRPRARLVKIGLETSRDQDSSLENSKSGYRMTSLNKLLSSYNKRLKLFLIINVQTLLRKFYLILGTRVLILLYRTVKLLGFNLQQSRNTIVKHLDSTLCVAKWYIGSVSLYTCDSLDSRVVYLYLWFFMLFIFYVAWMCNVLSLCLSVSRVLLSCSRFMFFLLAPLPDLK